MLRELFEESLNRRPTSEKLIKKTSSAIVDISRLQLNALIS
jgi:hypothetical protein